MPLSDREGKKHTPGAPSGPFHLSLHCGTMIDLLPPYSGNLTRTMGLNPSAAIGCFAFTRPGVKTLRTSATVVVNSSTQPRVVDAHCLRLRAFWQVSEYLLAFRHSKLLAGIFCPVEAFACCLLVGRSGHDDEGPVRALLEMHLLGPLSEGREHAAARTRTPQRRASRSL